MISAARPVYRIQRRGGKAQFSTTGGAKAPKSQNFPKIIRVPPYVKTGPQISEGGHGPPGLPLYTGLSAAYRMIRKSSPPICVLAPPPGSYGVPSVSAFASVSVFR